MLRRFLIAFTAVFIGGLAIEVLNYHQVTTIVKDRWSMVPQLSGTLLLFATLLVLWRASRPSIRFFASCCWLSIVVGIVGLAFHLVSHGIAPTGFGTATSWFGDPPPLAPLEFAVVGALGLLALAWERGGALQTQIPSGSSALYVLASLCALGAFVLAAATAPTRSFVAVTAALVIGALGYVVELTSQLTPRDAT